MMKWCKIVLTKLLHEKQFIIKNPEIFEFIIKSQLRDLMKVFISWLIN